MADRVTVVGRLRPGAPPLFHRADILLTRDGNVFLTRQAYTRQEFRALCENFLAVLKGLEADGG